MTLGQRLYNMRKANGLSQEKAAEVLGVTRQTISKWETDQTTPDFDKIIPLCKLYNISTDELLKGDADNTSCYDRSRYEIPKVNTQTDNSRQIDKYRKRSALLMSAAIFLYILSVVPFFLISNGKIMLTCFFVIIAAATMLIVFSQLSKPKQLKNTENQTAQSKLYKQITSIISGVVTVIYLLISFITGDWYITWIIWIIYSIICEIIKLIFQLKGAEMNNDEE